MRKRRSHPESVDSAGRARHVRNRELAVSGSAFTGCSGAAGVVAR